MFKPRAISTIALFIICSIFLSSCSTTPPQSQVAAKVEPWPTYDDVQAQEHISWCEGKYSQAEKMYAVLESERSDNDAIALLEDVNDWHMLVDEIAGKSGLFAYVHPNPEMRKAAQICEQRIEALAIRSSMSPTIYDHFDKANTSQLSEVDLHYVREILEEFRRSGVDLPKETRDKIQAINEEISKLGQSFIKNISEDSRKIELDSAKQLAGLPDDYIRAHVPGENGKIVLSTDYSDYYPFMNYAHDDEARLAYYKEFRLRGYPANDEVLRKLLEKRHELARILNYPSYAHLTMEDKMIETPERAANFINSIDEIAKARATKDYAILLERLKKIDSTATKVGDWQKTYIEKLVKKEQFDADPQEIRQYFAYNKVEQGIFDLTENLFGVTTEPWKTEVWHPSVKAFQVRENGDVIGQFYLDMHPREGKYKHAAHFGMRRGVEGKQLPTAALVCNFPGGDDGGTGLMEHEQVETFLHEFGHLLHGIFGGHQRWLGISGIATERDFVEAPSQMLEEWVWDPSTLKTFAKNANGKVIPDSLIQRMRDSRGFAKGLNVRHQMYYAALSLAFYNQDPSNIDFVDAMKTLQAKYSPYEYVDDTYFYTSFGHLYGYSAVYYTYMWSLVIASDMFSEFEREGLMNTELARRFRDTVLAPGGSKKAATLVEDFLGRPFSFDAFEKMLSVDAK